MDEKEFKTWYARIKDAVSRYGSVVERMAIIAGCFEAMQAETRLTAGQVSEILKLRIKKVPINEAATSGHSDITSILF